VGKITKHNFLGEVSFTTKKKTTAEVVAAEDVQLLVLTRDMIEKLSLDYPRINQGLNGILAKEMSRKLNAHKNVNGKWTQGGGKSRGVTIFGGNKGGGGEGGRKNRGMTMFGSAKKLSMSFKGKNGNKNSGGGGRGEETLPVVVGGDK